MTDHLIAFTIYAGFAIGVMKAMHFAILVAAGIERSLN